MSLQIINLQTESNYLITSRIVNVAKMPFSVLQILKNHKSTQDSIPVGCMIPAYQPHVLWCPILEGGWGWEGGHPRSHVWGWVGIHTPSGIPAFWYTHPTNSCIPTPSGIPAPWYAHPHHPPAPRRDMGQDIPTPRKGPGTRHTHTPMDRMTHTSENITFRNFVGGWL